MSNCASASLLFSKCAIQYTGTKTHFYVDTIFKLGIQALCKKLDIVINNVNFESQLIFIASFELKLTVQNTLFSAPLYGSQVPTSFIVYTYSQYYRIQLTSVTFMNVHMSDLLALTVARIQENVPIAAFVLRVHETGYSVPCENETVGTLEIITSNFTSNHRAISILLPNKKNVVIILKSQFINNKVEGHGGAVLITSEVNLGGNVFISDCHFKENQAGPLTRDVQSTTCRNRQLLSDTKILDCFYTGDHLFTIQTCIDVTGNNKSDCVLKTFQLQLSGSGGAIYTKNINLDVTNSTFYNNSAEEQGSAIASTGIISAMYVKGSHLYGPFQKPSNFDGSILVSFGTLVLEDSSFYVVYAFHRAVFCTQCLP